MKIKIIILNYIYKRIQSRHIIEKDCSFCDKLNWSALNSGRAYETMGSFGFERILRITKRAAFQPDNQNWLGSSGYTFLRPLPVVAKTFMRYNFKRFSRTHRERQ